MPQTLHQTVSQGLEHRGFLGVCRKSAALIGMLLGIPCVQTTADVNSLEERRLQSYAHCDDWARAAQVDLVLLPSTTGDFGVMPGHVPTVAQLRPGVITVHKELDKVGPLVPIFIFIYHLCRRQLDKPS